MAEFEVRLSSYGGELVCKPLDQGKIVNNKDVISSFERLKADLPRHRNRMALSLHAPAYLAQLDLKEQLIGDKAVRAMVEAFLFGTVRCAEIYLYKCQLGDASAQALACYLERAPKPGIHGLHISHNFFTPNGVRLLIDAARVSQMYPRQTTTHRGERTFAPLWLRVDNQRVPWKGFTGLSEIEQLIEAEKRVEELGARLLAKSQAEGILPKHIKPWETPRMICIPQPREGLQIAVDPTDEFSASPKLMASPCNWHRCKFCSPSGPIVHLPFFWMQNGNKDPFFKPPETASLSILEPNWKTWAPRVPIRDAAARKSAVAAAHAHAKAQAAQADREAKTARALEAAASQPPPPVKVTAAPEAPGRPASLPAPQQKLPGPMQKRQAAGKVVVRDSSPPAQRGEPKQRGRPRKVKQESAAATSWNLSGSRRKNDIDLDDSDGGEAFDSHNALLAAEAALQDSEASLAAEQAKVEREMKQALAALGGKAVRAAAKPGSRRPRAASATEAAPKKRQRKQTPPTINSPPPAPEPAEESEAEAATDDVEDDLGSAIFEGEEEEVYEEMEEEVQEDDDEELDLID